MKRAVSIGISIATGLLAAACGSASNGSPGGASPETGTTEPGASSAAARDVDPERGAAGVVEPGLLGAWENSSCGERKYRRRIEFFADGRFSALDEVAPCPPGAQCVWSGIVRWQGSWKIDGDLIELEPKPIEGERPLENPPDAFVVLGRDPYSIGEKTGELVCPYRGID
ncbi:MAG: hypothetical protein R6V85_13440 [Polyangia bacterium]